MGNTEKITGRILEDAREEAREIARQTDERIGAIRERGRTEADALLRREDEAAAEEASALKTRLDSAAALEARKRILREKQALVDEAFALARRKLLEMPREEYTELLASLAAKAAVTGRESIVLSEKDRSEIGAEICRRANETRMKAGLPAGLSLAERPEELEGGLILREGPVETNCTADVLIGGLRDSLAGQIAAILLQ